MPCSLYSQNRLCSKKSERLRRSRQAVVCKIEASSTVRNHSNLGQVFLYSLHGVLPMHLMALERVAHALRLSIPVSVSTIPPRELTSSYLSAFSATPAIQSSCFLWERHSRGACASYTRFLPGLSLLHAILQRARHGCLFVQSPLILTRINRPV